MAKFIMKEEFINTIKEMATKYGTVEIRQVNRADMSYTGLMIEKIGVPTPVVNIDALYADYCNGRPIEDCIAKAEEILNMKPDEVDFTIADMMKWDKVKDRLFLRLVGNITDGLYRTVAEDMYLVPYISVSEEKGMAARVVPGLLDEWGIDEEELFEQAKRSQEILRPAKIESLAKRIGAPDEGLPFYIVGTEYGVCGASAIMYSGMVDKVRKKIGDFYIIPASVHEVIVIAKSVTDDIERLKLMVEMVNDTDVDDVLTNSIYSFDFDTQEFIKLA